MAVRKGSTPAHKRVEPLQHPLRGLDGSAFLKCDKCKVSMPVATASLHECVDKEWFSGLLEKIREHNEAAQEEARKLRKSQPEGEDEVQAPGKKGAGQGRGRGRANASKPKKEKEPKEPKDPDAPKRAPTAYMIFMEKHRSVWKTEHPDEKMSVAELAKSGGAEWKAMSAEEKLPYEEEAKERKAAQETALADYELQKKEGAREDVEEGVDESAHGSAPEPKRRRLARPADVVKEAVEENDLEDEI